MFIKLDSPDFNNYCHIPSIRMPEIQLRLTGLVKSYTQKFRGFYITRRFSKMLVTSLESIFTETVNIAAFL